jgi:uncharacterized delta-60 repeat protein
MGQVSKEDIMEPACTIKTAAKFLCGFVVCSLLLSTIVPVAHVKAEDGGPAGELQAAEGELDTTFGSGGIVTTDFGSKSDWGESAVLQPDGKIVVGGYAFLDTNSDFALARYLPDGSLDPSFGGDGTILTDFENKNDLGKAVALQPDGRILMAGYTYSMECQFALARYNSDGSLDNTFDSDGKVTSSFINGDDYATSIALQPDGKIILGGTRQGNSTAFILVRYNNDGSLDKSFGVSGIVMTDVGQAEGVNDVGIQPQDGKIIAAGRVLKDDNLFYLMLTRYNIDGSLDTTFGPGGKLFTNVGTSEFSADLALQPDGTILVAGSAENIGADRDFVLLRFNSDGFPDTTFDSDGMVVTDFGGEDDGAAVAVQPDGRILMAGSAYQVSQFALARYWKDGSLDTSFGTEGKVTTYAGGFSIANDMLLQPNHRIIVVGSSTSDTNLNFAMARFINRNTPRTHYVNQAASGANTGTSWEDAFTDLQSAIATASSGDTILVASGIYKPTPGMDRTVSFKLKSGVRIYGGYAGTETDPYLADPAANLTVLSGDIGVVGVKNDNSYHVVVGSGVDFWTTGLDGFTITGGYADGPAGSPEANGAGMYNVSCRPYLSRLVFTGNEAVSGGGGGMYNSSSKTFLIDVTFRGNTAGSLGGGGMYNENSQPSLVQVTFDRNSTCCGGGMANYKSNPSVYEVTFTGNTALDFGGGMYNRESSPSLNYVNFTGNQAALGGGGLYNDESSRPSLYQVSFTENSASLGGGMSNANPSGSSLHEVTFHGNAANRGGGIYTTGSLGLRNVTLENNMASSEGGGLYNSGSMLSLVDVRFIRNSAAGHGGGMFSNGRPYLHDVTFLENSSGDSGGGMYNVGGAWMANVTFNGNSAVRGGGLFAHNKSLSSLVLSLSNTTLYGNSAKEGGGLYNDNNDDYGSVPRMRNVTFSGNMADLGNAIYNNYGPLGITNSILYDGNSGDEIHNEEGISFVEYNIVRGGYEGTGNLDVDPKLSPLANNGGLTQTMALQPDSPAVDAGLDLYCEKTDQRGETRPQGKHCDMGAYEFHISGPLPEKPTFTDVPLTHPYWQDIEILYANGLTGGCATNPLKYCPDQIMNRGQAAVFVLRAYFGSSYVPSDPTHIFQDDWSKGPWAEPWAESMKLEGLSAGCLANPLKYCPWAQIPREQAVIFALRMKYGTLYTPPPATGTVFADMTNPVYYATAWAEQAYKEGIIPNCGTSGGKPKFCPKDLVSRGLAAYMIVRARNLMMP